MMSDWMALKIAIDLIHVPSQVRLVRSEPLPDGILTLLRIAAGDDEAQHAAIDLTDRPIKVVRQAATFFIEQILFAPNADSYRVLGASPGASAVELRRNVALLLRWLHPDLDPQEERRIFIGKITAAWNDLKTPERRAAYDEQQRRLKSRRQRSKTGKVTSQRRNGGTIISSARVRGETAEMRGTPRFGFLRRTLSIIFHRPT